MGSASHESALERDFVTLTSFAYPDALITSQPVTIHFLDGEIRRRYTPDFLTCRRQEPDEFIEVKYLKDLQANESRLKAAFNAARTFADGQGTIFRVVTEQDIRGARLNNAKRLLPLRRLPVDRKLTLLALTAARSQRAPTFRTILAAMPQCPAALATVWRLLARKVLRVDLDVPFSFDTAIKCT
jgi:hypothetical protein